MTYRPPTKVVTTSVPYQALVAQADPEHERLKHREPYFEVAPPTGQRYHDPYTFGAYNRRSNVYPVGQPYGGADAAVTAALAPTVGNAVPGLYQGTKDGGWA